MIELSSFVFSGFFVTVCLLLTLLLPKQIILKQMKLAKQRKYKIAKKLTLIFIFSITFLFIICLLLNNIKQAKEKRMTYNNNRNAIFFSRNILEIQDSTRNSFLRSQLSYFPPANIRLHRYDSFFRFIYCFWVT